MRSSLTTTYCGHSISVEPCEWGYLAQVLEPASGKRYVAGSSSAFRALEDAFDIVDDNVAARSDQTVAPQGEPSMAALPDGSQIT
jgi:hypothetical protein